MKTQEQLRPHKHLRLRRQSLFSDEEMERMRVPIQIRIVRFVEAFDWDNYHGYYFRMEQDFKPIDLDYLSYIMNNSNNRFIHLKVCEDNHYIITKEETTGKFSLSNYSYGGAGWFPTGEYDYNLSSFFIEEIIMWFEKDLVLKKYEELEELEELEESEVDDPDYEHYLKDYFTGQIGFDDYIDHNLI